MGNEQSAPAPRGPRNKLSKPRTNSSANTSNSKSPGPPSRHGSLSNHVGISNNRYSTISVDTVLGEAAEKRKEESGQRKRMSMFRSKSSQAKVQELEINNAVNIDFLEPGDRWSRSIPVKEDLKTQRHYSAPLESHSRPTVRTARMSLQPAPYSQHHTRLSLVPEAPSPLPDSIIQRRRSIQQHNNANLEVGPQRRQSIQQYKDDTPKLSEPLSTRTNSDTALYAPIRRRSLLQHGVATRKSWIEKNDSRQSLPAQITSQTDLQNYYYNPTKPTSSPLSDLANLATPKFADNEPCPRVATPNDLDYGHIGAYKLGSLRITNGAASPAPSLERPATTGGGDDYINVDEIRRSAESHRTVLWQRNDTISVPSETARPPWITRTESPLRQEYNEVKKLEPLEPLTIDTQLPLPEFSLFKFNNSESPTRSLDLARGYQEDLALSPFSFDNSPPTSPRLQATSKHMAVEDDLFEPEPGTPEVSEFRVRKSLDSGYRTESNATLDTKKTVKGPRDLAPKPLAKADSGYSSNVSLRSFRSNPPPSVPAKDAPPTPPKPVSRVASSTYSITTSPSTKSDITIRTKRSLPALPQEEQMPTQPYRQPPPVPLKHSSISNSGKSTPAPSLPPKSPDQVWAAAESRPHVIMKPRHNHVRSQSIPSVSRVAQEGFNANHSPSGSEVSTSSTGSTSRWRPRSRSRSQSVAPPEPVFTVQAFHAPSDQFGIPPVSAEARRKLEERVDAFPVNCLPNTERRNPMIRRTISRETLGTIFSVGSAEWREELTYQRLQSSLPRIPRVPVPSPILESPTPPVRPEFNRRYTYQAPMQQAPPRKPVRQSLQPGPRSNPALQQKIRQDFETEITSFDNISSSLGSSPYDAALSASPDAKRKQQERAKSMTAQFEADAAARYARARTVSQESQYSQTLQRATSYDSITNQNPWTNGSSAGNSRVSSREFPPQAHGNVGGRAHSMLPPRRSNPNLRDDLFGDEKRHSLMSVGSSRMKSPPPISMQNQRKHTPSHIGNQMTNPPSHGFPQQQPQFVAPPPNRTPPQPPLHASPMGSDEKEVHDPWSQPRDFWASRKQNALQTRKSMEMRRPAPRFSYDNPIPRPESARPSMEFQRPQMPQLSHHISFDNSEKGRSKSYGPWAPRKEWQEREHEYDHTYGSFENKENSQHYWQQEEEEKYYDAPSQGSDDFQYQNIQRSIHANNSTSDMLILDRFAGGLGYGYEPGYGLGGSAGTRNVGKMADGGRKGVDVSVNYGLDFSDVPVFLQRVKIES